MEQWETRQLEGKTLWTSPLSDRKVPSVFLRNFVSRVFRFLFVYLFYIFLGDYNGIFRLSQTSFSQICSTIASYEERNVEFELMRNGKNNLNVKFDRLHSDIYIWMRACNSQLVVTHLWGFSLPKLSKILTSLRLLQRQCQYCFIWVFGFVFVYILVLFVCLLAVVVVVVVVFLFFQD